jgi:hypothetical protein
MGTGLEKRKFQRLEFQLEVAVELEEAGGTPKKDLPLRLKSRNISHIGICLETDSLKVNPIRLLSGAPGARNYRLRMRVVLFQDEEPLEAVGEVCWYDIVHEPSEYRYQLGIDFLEITERGKDQLIRFLKSHRNGEGLFRRLFG